MDHLHYLTVATTCRALPRIRQVAVHVDQHTCIFLDADEGYTLIDQLKAALRDLAKAEAEDAGARADNMIQIGEPRRYGIGAAVTMASVFCPGCMDYTGPMTGTVVGFVRNGDQSALYGDDPGPFYVVDVDHVHNAGGRLVYPEGELHLAAEAEARAEGEEVEPGR